MFRRLALIFAVLGTTLSAQAAVEPAQLAPASSLIYLAVERPQVILDRALDQALIDKVTGLDQAKDFLAGNQFQQVRFFVSLLEQRLGVKWPQALADLTGGGIYFSIEAADQAALLIIRSKDPALMTKLHEALVEMANADATSKGKPSPIMSEDYHGTMIYKGDNDAEYAYLEDLLIVSNKGPALRAALDRSRGMGSSLSSQAAFEQARNQSHARTNGDPFAAAPPVAWGYVNLEGLRQIPDVLKALGPPTNNPLSELVLGGVLDAAHRANSVSVALDWVDGRARLRAQMPHDQAAVNPARSWFFASPEDKDRVKLSLPGTIANLRIDRNISGMWINRDELFTDDIKSGLAQADSFFGLFFSGRDFGSEVLSEVSPRWHVVVTRQDFSGDRPLPALKLPAFALVFRLKDPNQFARHLLMGYQNIVGIININGAQNKQPQFLLATEDLDGTVISKATYLVDDKTPKEQAPVNYNFSPSSVQVGEWFVISSTVELARDLVRQLRSPSSLPEGAASAQVNLFGGPLAEALADNRELLISQNMLQQGNDRPAAEQAIGILLDLIRQAGSAEASLKTEAANLVLDVEVKSAN